MDRNRYGKILEDVGLAIQNLDAGGCSKDAEWVRLVSMHKMYSLAKALDEFSTPIHPVAILAAAHIVMQQERRKDRAPLVSLGQGDYRRDISEDEVEPAPEVPLLTRGVRVIRSLAGGGR